MIAEAMGAAFLFLALGLLGLGPALYFMPKSEKRVGWALGMAPALGFLLVALLAFPLVRYLAPATVWARPFTLLFILLSLGLAYHDWRTQRAGYRILHNGRAVLCNGLFLAACYLVLVAPLVIKGIGYAVFRSNASDAYMYVSLAESFRTVDWTTLMNGIALRPENMAGIKHLAEVSPTALYSARHIAKPLPLSGPATLAWAAELVRAPLYRFQYAYNTALFLSAAALALVLADRLRATPVLRYLAAAAVAFGFWARFVLNTDSSYQIASVSLLLLVAFAWILVEEDPRPWTRPRMLLGVAAAVMFWFYFPLVAVVVVAGLLHYLVGLVRGERTILMIVSQGVTLAVGALALALTGQMDFVYRNALYLLAGASTEGQFRPKAFLVLTHNGLAALWGFPSRVLAQAAPAFLQTPVRLGFELFGALLLLLFLATAIIVLFRRSDLAERIVGALVMSGLFLLVLLFALGSLKPAGQAFTYVYAFIILFGVLYAQVWAPESRAPLRALASVAVVVWLGGQSLLGAALPFSGLVPKIMPIADAGHRSRYDISAILAYLDGEGVQGLLVSVPDADQWQYNMYLQFAFAPYQPYFQNGILIDNTTQYRNIWLDNARSSYRYAVVAKDADYIGFDRLGMVVAESDELLLYKLTDSNPALIAKQERALRQREEQDPPFPILASSP